MKSQVRLNCTWKLLRFLIKPFVTRRFHYSAQSCDLSGPLLVMANHNTNWDPLLVGCSFPNYLSFVASEHIFRWGFLSRLICFLLDPIARMKGTTAGDTALTMMRKLKKGVSVAIFAEGNRSFDGLTAPILPATGKLARSSGATLVTYRLSGGYFASPRWSGSKMRRGKMSGRVVNVYTPEQLKAMTVAEVNAAIAADLFEDAYAEQRKAMIPYEGKNLAEHLETVLCRCPKCGRLDTLRSHDDMLSCACGFSVKYNVYGFLEGEDAPFDNITDWDKAQTEALIAAIPTDGSAIFSDSDMILTEILPGHKTAALGCGDMRLFAEHMECCGKTFPLASLSGFSLHSTQTVNFSCASRSYEISSEKVRCTRKYMTVIEHLKSLET